MRMNGEMQDRKTEEVEVALAVLRPRLLSVLAQYQIPPADGDDLLQEAVIAALGQWDRIENRQAWLLTVLRYRCSLYRRRRNCWKRLILAMDPDDLQALAKPMDPPQELQDIRRDLRRLMRDLSPDELRLLTMRFVQNLGRKEVASRLGCHPANVPKVLHRILVRLKTAAAPVSL
jgi:RNA polymerase sigma factor (sigma-70 family)